MPAILGWIVGNWRLVAMGVIAAAVAAVIVSDRFEISRLRAANVAKAAEAEKLSGALSDMTALAHANGEAAQRLARERDLAVTTLARERDAATARLSFIEEVNREIASAPASDSAALSPVLRRALERLRERQRASAAGGD